MKKTLPKKYFYIMIGITLSLLIAAFVFEANTYVIAAAIGGFVNSIIQFFIHSKRADKV
jgi:hypothetical protein